MHLLSNRKWTERSEPVVDLVRAQKALGAQVIFVCGRSPEGGEPGVAFYARRNGLDPVIALKMPKHFRALPAFRDAAQLKKIIAEFRPSIVHCHMRNAHLVGSLANYRRNPLLVVRSCYNPDGPKNDFRSGLLYKHSTDGIIVINEFSKEKAISRYGFSSHSTLIAEPGVDLYRFSPERKVPLARKDFGLRDDTFVVGVVSRIRQSRRIDITLGALNLLAKRFPRLRLLIIGRGRKGAVEEVVGSPSRVLGIADKVILPGYCHGDRLVAAYRAMDVLVYPVPGTDKTCRTVREALASGIPVIAPKIGFLPELLENGVNGRFMDLSAQSLANVLAGMISDQEKLCQMAQNAAR
ncbi:MAG: glycosyltransferase family 4 protein, partial [Deltaproteobacteria bacterium]|nr:glycosyltransferase family 4 protein [Deltaproteobacteria bacterium]